MNPAAITTSILTDAAVQVLVVALQVHYVAVQVPDAQIQAAHGSEAVKAVTVTAAVPTGNTKNDEDEEVSCMSWEDAEKVKEKKEIPRGWILRVKSWNGQPRKLLHS